MFRTFSIVGITTIALAAAPQVQARSSLDNFLLGATAIAILGIAVNKSKARPAPVIQPYEHPRPSYTREPVRMHKPKHCLRQRWTNTGWVTYYSKQCLTRYRLNHDYSFNR